MRPTDTLGRSARGVVSLVAARGRVNLLWQERWGGSRRQVCGLAPARVWSAGPVAGRMTEGAPKVNSIARRSTPCQAASVRGQSNQVLSEVLRAGRASTAGLSPLSTPDSILMCIGGRKRGCSLIGG